MGTLGAQRKRHFGAYRILAARSPRAADAGELASPAGYGLAAAMRIASRAPAVERAGGRPRTGGPGSQVRRIHRAPGGAGGALSSTRIAADPRPLRLRRGSAVARRGEGE